MIVNTRVSLRSHSLIVTTIALAVTATPALAQTAAPAAAQSAAAGEPAEGPVAAADATEAAPADEAGVTTSYATDEDLQGIRTDLENFKWQWQRERDLHTGLSTRPLLIGGVVSARVGAQNEPVRGAGIDDRRYTFDLGQAQLIFTGNLYRDYQEGRNLSYVLRFGAAQSNNNSFLNLSDANITYSLLQALSPEDALLTVTLGQQLVPFGLEVATSDELRPVINNAQFANRLGLGRREIGLFVKGDVLPRMDYGYAYRQALLSYALCLVSGNGPNAPDDNGWKDIILRTAFTVPSDYHSLLRQFTVGGTAYLGKQNRMLPSDTTRTVLGLGRRRRYGADVYYNHHPIGLTYEFVQGEDGLLEPQSTLAAPRAFVRKSRAHVATLFYNFGEQFVRGYRAQGRFDDWWPKSYQPFFRFDTFDPDMHAANDASDVFTWGFNIFFAETTKFQLNYNYRHDRALEPAPGRPAPPASAGVYPRVHEVLAQLQFGF
jgi:hypothetical protein